MTRQRSVDFVGRGWAYPMRIDSRGGVALQSGGDEIDAAIRMILSTAPGERLMRPEFGCEIWDLLFAPINSNTLGMMSNSVEAALQRWEPRAEVESVETEPNGSHGGRVDITVTYRVLATNDRRNLVYPFYVIPGEDG